MIDFICLLCKFTSVYFIKNFIRKLKMFGSQEQKSSEIIEKYKQLAALIKQKFALGDIVDYHYNDTGMTFTFNDNSFVNGTKEDERPIKFLEAFGGVISTKRLEVSYLTERSCKLTTAQCLQAIQALQQIKTPTGPDANPQRIAYC
jgi:hypothetical protein